MHGKQWARLQADYNLRLRRGAWYRIRQLGPLQTVLEVKGQALQVPSAFLQVSEQPPRKWSIVTRPSDAVHLPANWGDRYAVCPSCQARQPLAGRRGLTRRMSCKRCRGEFEIAWQELADSA